MASRRTKRQGSRLGAVEGGATAALALAAARALYRRARAARAARAPEPAAPPPGVVSALERAVVAAQRAAEQVRPRGSSERPEGDRVSDEELERARAELAEALSRRVSEAA